MSLGHLPRFRSSRSFEVRHLPRVRSLLFAQHGQHVDEPLLLFVSLAHSFASPSLNMPPKRRRDINSDVVALVIDHLEGDPRSLLACALTHKTWYPHTMKVLYATIRIRSRRACDALRARHTQPIDHCVAYTKVLEIHEESTGRFARWAILRLSDLPFLSLKRLVLTGIDYASGDDSPHPFWQVHGSLCRFGSVTTLELVKCTFPTFRHFLKLISSVPQLRRLKLAGLCAAAIPSILADAPVTTASRGLKLEELDMKGLSGRNLEHELLTWLSSDGGDGWAHTANLHVLRIRPAPLSQPNNWDATICDSITNVLDALAPLALTELAIPCMSQGAQSSDTRPRRAPTHPTCSAREPRGIQATPEPHALPAGRLLR